MAEPVRVSMREAAERLAELGVRAATAYGRTDLAEHLETRLGELHDSAAVVLVAGEFKTGKSSLVNALVGRAVCPTDDDIATAIPTVVRHATEPWARAHLRGERDEDVELEVATLPDWVVEGGHETVRPGLGIVEVGVPSTLLRSGLSLVDMPGAGGTGTIAGGVLTAALPAASGVLFVSDAGQGLTAAEHSYLQRLRSSGVPLALVKTKIDIHPAWATVATSDERLLSGAGDIVLATSSELATRARRTKDRELAAESGLTPVGDWLRALAAEHRRRLTSSIAGEVRFVAEQLRAPFSEELRAIGDPDAQRRGSERMLQAKEEASRLRSAASRWQQVMVDAYGDIGNDVDYELRAGMRELLRTIDNHLDTVDPATTWSDYEPEVRRSAADLVNDHYTRLQQRILDATQRVVDVFAEDALRVEDAIGLTDAVSRTPGSTALELKDMKKAGIGGTTLGIVRASYSGALLTGFLSGVFGLSLAAPVALLVGLAVGFRGFRQDAERQLNQRRAQAKAAVHKYADEILFVVNKDGRDLLRRSQRDVRDHFSRQADQLLRTATAAYEQLQRDAGAGAQQREQRQRDLAAELERLDWLITAADDVHRAVLEVATT